MSKLKFCYNCLVDALSGGRLYHSQWMSRHNVPPVPAWTVQWLFNFKDWCRRRR